MACMYVCACVLHTFGSSPNKSLTTLMLSSDLANTSWSYIQHTFRPHKQTHTHMHTHSRINSHVYINNQFKNSIYKHIDTYTCTPIRKLPKKHTKFSQLRVPVVIVVSDIPLKFLAPTSLAHIRFPKRKRSQYTGNLIRLPMCVCVCIYTTGNLIRFTGIGWFHLAKNNHRRITAVKLQCPLGTCCGIECYQTAIPTLPSSFVLVHCTQRLKQINKCFPLK